MIGNGLDIQLGLQTRYTDFYQWVTQRRELSGPDSKRKEKNGIYADIKSNIEKWSDFEIGFCDYCKRVLARAIDSEESRAKEEIVLDELEAVRTDLMTYLTIQEKKFITPSKDLRIRMLAQTFMSLFDGVMSGEDEIIKSLIASHPNEQTHIDLIDFNYTNLLDRLVNDVGLINLNNKYKSKSSQNSDYFARINGHYHIHGTIGHLVMIGVDNSAQIGDGTFSQSNLRYVLKPEGLQNDRENVFLKVQRVIEASDLFVIYGMSIGETDLTYWKAIASNLLANKKSFLVIHAYDCCPDYSSLRMIEMTRTQVENRFIDQVVDNDDQRSQLRQQIFVVYRSQKIFQMEKVDANK